jgi:hypothetical protein
METAVQTDLAGLRGGIRQALGCRQSPSLKEDQTTEHLRTALTDRGRFCRTADGNALFFRTADRKLYEISDRSDSPFGQLITYLADLSVTNPVMRRSLDRLRAWAAQEADVVEVHGLAYNSADADVIAVNDFGGGMWYRERGGQWKHRQNGDAGLLFWTPLEFVEPWKPQFNADPAENAAHLQGLLDAPHFADDVMTARDQRLLLRALLLAPLFPSRCRVRPIQAHLGLSQQRQHDTGKTMAGKILGALFVGSQFQPTPVTSSSDRAEEAVQLALMHQPFVLLDNVDTDIRWLNDFLCTYATGARPTKRKLYSDTTQVHVEYRGRLCITSRQAKFNRADTASRTIPFRFRPIEANERRTEHALLGPVLASRGAIWGGLLNLVARVQDALPTLSPPQPESRLADFEQLGWCVAAVDGEQEQWQGAIQRLMAAQGGFALEDEVLLPVLKELLANGDLPEQPSSKLYEACKQKALDRVLELPHDAAAFMRRVNEIRSNLESQLDIRITTRILGGQTLIRVTRGPSWGDEVTEVTEDRDFSYACGG